MTDIEMWVYGSRYPQTTNIILDRIVQCPLCGCMTCFFKNMKGTSYCYRCAPEPENPLL